MLLCDISNFGALALARVIGRSELCKTLLREEVLLPIAIEAGIVDGVLGIPAESVDGMPAIEYYEICRKIWEC